ncbi:MAG: histidine phosphatase family protein [Candidatus Paceibacterota bacterium]
MKLYLVRHAESQFNKAKRHQHAEVPLAENGIKQAGFLARRFKDLKIDRIISSPFERTMQTAKVIENETGAPLEVFDLLREVKVPTELIGKQTTDPDVVSINQKIIDNFKNGEWKYSDEESFSEIKSRCQKILKHITEFKDSESIVAVSHARTIRFLISLILFGERLSPMDYMGFWSLEISNTGVSVADYKPEIAVYNNGNPWRVLTINDCKHLP